MRRMVMGCTLAALVAITAHTDASPSRAYIAAHLAPIVTKQVVGEMGLASWYGEQFQGNATASGEIYDMDGLTAASRTLPLGTKVRVTNLRNNRSLVLRINDRGPYIHNRSLDVSKAAAWKLGFMGSGLAKVKMEVVSYPKGYTLNQN